MDTPTDDSLPYLSAKDAVSLFRQRRLSPVELMTALIDRMERIDPAINAVADKYFDEALEKAHKAEARYCRTDGRIRPLEGVPLAVKDEMEIKGKLTTNGSLYLTDNVGTETHYSVERLMRAGAIVHMRTTAPEFSCAAVTHSKVHGVTGTPWDPAYTCGGSSGGSAAALAAGVTTLATGSDIGGSIRVPAAACGVVGFKPPHGRNPENTPYAYDPYAAPGPMTRSVDDCTLMQNVMCGPHPLDNASLRPKYRIPGSPKGIEGWRIAFSMNLDFFEIHDDVERNTLRVLDHLRALRAEVNEVEFGWSLEADRAVQDYLNHLFGSFIAAHVDSDPTKASSWAIFCAEAHKRVTVERFMHAFEVQADIARRVGRILESHDAFICPTLGTHEVPADHTPDVEVHINGKSVDPFYGWALCHPFNMLGRCPVLAVPSGVGRNGLPTGIQIVARQFDDQRVFRVGAALERVQPWLDTKDRRPKVGEPMLTNGQRQGESL